MLRLETIFLKSSVIEINFREQRIWVPDFKKVSTFVLIVYLSILELRCIHVLCFMYKRFNGLNFKSLYNFMLFNLYNLDICSFPLFELILELFSDMQNIAFIIKTEIILCVSKNKLNNGKIYFICGFCCYFRERYLLKIYS